MQPWERRGRTDYRDATDLILKTKNLHVLFRHAAAFQILCKLMMHCSDDLHGIQSVMR